MRSTLSIVLSRRALPLWNAKRSFSGTSRAAYEERGPKNVLVVGSSGSLGSCLVQYLSKNLGATVIGADVLPNQKNHLSGGFVELPTNGTQPAPLVDLTMALTDGLYHLLGSRGLDAVVCVAGAWEGDPAPMEEEDDPRTMLATGAREYADSIDRMLGKNLYPVLAAGYASQHFLKADNEDGGLFVGIGATVALGGGTPGMLGYGLSKAGTHHFLQTLGEATGNALTSKSKRKLTRKLRQEQKYLRNLSVVGILPTTIDTKANRKAMPDADFSQWTKSIDIAKEIGVWLEEPSLRPHSGSLVKVHPKKNGEGAEFQVAR